MSCEEKGCLTRRKRKGMFNSALHSSNAIQRWVCRGVLAVPLEYPTTFEQVRNLQGRQECEKANKKKSRSWKARTICWEARTQELVYFLWLDIFVLVLLLSSQLSNKMGTYCVVHVVLRRLSDFSASEDIMEPEPKRHRSLKEQQAADLLINAQNALLLNDAGAQAVTDILERYSVKHLHTLVYAHSLADYAPPHALTNPWMKALNQLKSWKSTILS